MLRKLLLLFVISCSLAYNVELDWTYILSNPDDLFQQRAAYFGYTVALITTTSSSWALVGAPRANDTQVLNAGVRERGALYLCELPAFRDSCRQLIVTNAANGSVGGGGNFEYETMQDNGWLGGSLDLRPNDPDSVIVTCSPRWINQKYTDYNDFFMNGACYVTTIKAITSSGAVTRPWKIVTPLVDNWQQVAPDDNGVNVFYYQLGQAGLSVHVSEGSDQLWLGAPGMQQWTGSVARVMESSSSTGNWKNMDSKTFKPADKSMWSDYFGYSVESGNFFGSEMHQVAGSPRHELVGKVSVFTTREGRIQVRWERTGPQIGSYFGAAVTTGDVNADGWSELFVGAPLFTVGTATDSGVVIIYSRKANLDNLEEGGRLIGSGKAGSRFGSALTVVGDLDRDGYQDLAVGAPYEEDGAGAVYLYRGSANGLLTTYSQKVKAKDVNFNLKGFGISISRGTDVDRNGYTDLAVGAHEGNGAAVVLRTRPVLKVQFVASSDSEVITEPGMTFSVTTCVSYNGFNVLDEIKMTIVGVVDDGAVPARAMFVDSGTPKITFKETVQRGRENCQISSIKLQDKIENYAQSLEVLFKVEETYDNPGCEKCGVNSPDSKLRSKVEIPLVLGCGADAVCTPELDLAVTWKEGASELALRSQSTATLSIMVSVTGKDYSYVGQVKLVLPEGLTAHQPLPYSCSLNSKMVLCKLPNPMTQGEKNVFEISVEESGDLKEGKVPLKVSCSAHGTQDVKKEIILSVIEDVKLELIVQVSEDMIQYGPPPSPPAASEITYQVINKGETRVNEVILDMLIATEYDELSFAQITQQATSSSLTSECSLEDSLEGVEPGNIGDPSHEVSVKLVCGQQPLLSCKRVICTVREVHDAPIITVEVAYNTTILKGKLGPDITTIAIYSSATAAYGTPTPAVYTESGKWIILTPMDWLPPKSTPAWPYVVAVLVGLLILAVVVVVLVKIGFFKRKRPGQTPDNANEDLEGQAEGEHETSPLQDTEPEREETRTTMAEVEAHSDIEDDSASC